MISVQTRTAWSDYFTGTPTPLQPNEYTSRQTPSSTSVYVSNCLFKSITSGSDGGALYCSTSVASLLVESSSFFTCKTSSQTGGAVYFSNTNNGQCVFYKVCGYECFPSRSDYLCGLFCHTNVYNTASSKNYVNYSSITRCITQNSNSQFTLYLGNGKNCCPSVNISMNKCGCRSGICCWPVGNSNSVITSFSYCSFADNIASSYNCIWVYAYGSDVEFKSCNIIRNTQPLGNTEGTIFTRGNVIIENSCILENIATYVLHAASYTITLSNCTVDSTSNYGSLITQNTVTKSFILALNHMSTQNCHTEYDRVGTLTPIAPLSSSSKKQIYCYTGNKLCIQVPQGNMFSLISLFAFNFIHPYSSIDSIC
jgi:hypothetical protein